MLGRVSSSPSAFKTECPTSSGADGRWAAGWRWRGWPDSPCRKALDRVVAGSHRHTGRLVPKAVDHLDERKGRLADCGLWRIVDNAAMGVSAVLPVEGEAGSSLWKVCQTHYILNIRRIFTTP